ncbi:MAG: cell division protein FtsZ [Rikenellaceae bacterium]
MSYDILNEINVKRESSSIIAVVGVGGAGGNAVNHMYEMGIHGVEFMVCNTDSQDLERSPVPNKIQMGDGLGAGNKPEIGRAKAVESSDDLRRFLERNNTKMLFITAGMGGGTGTGASPVLAKIAHEMGILIVAIVTIPSVKEGPVRFAQGHKGLDELKECVDSLLVINNENIGELYGDLSIRQAFKKADEILCLAAKGIAEIITVQNTFVNVDFADVSNVVRDSGRAHMSVVKTSGDNRAVDAAEAALSSPLLDCDSIVGAKNILLNFSAKDIDTFKHSELNAVIDYVQDVASIELESGEIQSANIIWGANDNPSLEDGELELILVATGFDEQDSRMSKPLTTLNKSRLEEPSKIVTLVDNIEDKVADVANEVEISAHIGISDLSGDVDSEEPVTLGDRVGRYDNIDTILKRPAYITRRAKFVTIHASSQAVSSGKSTGDTLSLDGGKSFDN